MSRPSADLRVRRTQKLLREALVELIEERTFDRLTVGEIAERAMVSRAAFYRNYRDKFDLVERIFDDAMDELVGAVSEGEPEPRAAAERWERFFAHIGEYRRLYGALLGRKGSPWFADRMRQALSGMVAQHLDPPVAEASRGRAGQRRPPTRTLPAAVLGAMFLQSITWWLENDCTMPAEEIAAQSARLAGAVIETANTVADEARVIVDQ